MGTKSLVREKKIDTEQGYLEARTLSSPPCWVVWRFTVTNYKMSTIQNGAYQQILSSIFLIFYSSFYTFWLLFPNFPRFDDT